MNYKLKWLHLKTSGKNINFIVLQGHDVLVRPEHTFKMALKLNLEELCLHFFSLKKSFKTNQPCFLNDEKEKLKSWENFMQTVFMGKKLGLFLWLETERHMLSHEHELLMIPASKHYFTLMIQKLRTRFF